MSTSTKVASFKKDASKRARLEKIKQAQAKLPAPTPKGIEARWRAFRKAHPHVFARALELARADLAKQELEAKAKRISIASIWERLRGKVGAPLDNSFRSLVARALLAAEPRLHGVLETRQRRTP